MIIQFSPHAWEDYVYWQRTDKTVVKKINRLIDDILRNPFDGIGKPEPLKFEYSGFWSRRINLEHRLVYCVEESGLQIVSCRFHYDK
jgi:toxin YoeB